MLHWHNVYPSVPRKPFTFYNNISICFPLHNNKASTCLGFQHLSIFVNIENCTLSVSVKKQVTPINCSERALDKMVGNGGHCVCSEMQTVLYGIYIFGMCVCTSYYWSLPCDSVWSVFLICCILLHLTKGNIPHLLC